MGKIRKPTKLGKSYRYYSRFKLNGVKFPLKEGIDNIVKTLRNKSQQIEAAAYALAPWDTNILRSNLKLTIRRTPVGFNVAWSSDTSDNVGRVQGKRKIYVRKHPKQYFGIVARRIFDPYVDGVRVGYVEDFLIKHTDKAINKAVKYFISQYNRKNKTRINIVHEELI